MTETLTDITGPQGRQLITFHVRDQEYCVDIEAVREIRVWTPATSLPQAPAYVSGVMNLRGAVLPVVDMAVRLGLPKAAETARQVIIVVWIGRQLVGLVVDSVSEILAAPDEAFQTTPEMGAETLNVLVGRLLTIDDRLVGLIALDRLLPAAEAAA